MKERPLLFSAPMVLALLEGRKTMTRRLVKYHPTFGFPDAWCPLAESTETNFVRATGDYRSYCPFGVAGNRIWVKETWRPDIAHGHGMDARDCADVNVTYAADGAVRFFKDSNVPDGWALPKASVRSRTAMVSPLFMPRWASRITLEVVNTRVERLHGISADDVVAEGICPSDVPGLGSDASLIEAFRRLWDSINGLACPWSANPWLWVVTFKRVEGVR